MTGLRDTMTAHAPIVLALGGGLIGLAFGAVLQRTGFCAMGGVADWHNMGDTRRMRAWVLAAALALLGTQAMAWFEIVAIDTSMYRAPTLNWVGNLAGGACFGFGMVLAGGCTSRNLVRAGAGDLRAGLNVLVVGIAAFAAIGGVLGPARAALEGATAIDLASRGVGDQGLAAIAVRAGLFSKTGAAQWVALLLGGAALVWCFASRPFTRSPRHVLSGVGVAACVVAGWALTGLAFDEVAARPLPPVSLTFVRPAGDALDWLQRFTALGIPGFGVTSVVGAVVGSFLAAAAAGRLKLQTFADAADTVRNLAGAVMMGIGGVMALGCTIGQGVTGVSTLALGSLLAFAGMIAGAKAALAVLERWA